MRLLDFAAAAFPGSRNLLFAALLTMMVPAGLPYYLRGAEPSAAAAASPPQITVVDIMPESLSGETANDSEPDIAVNPTEPSQIAASALTRDPMGATTAPIFVSTDGGNTWSCRSVVPSSHVTCDITLGFGTSSSVLYVSAIRNQLVVGEADFQPFELVICKSGGFASARVMDEVFTRQGQGIDQPYLAAITVNQKDRVFVGNNDSNGPNGHTATVALSLDAIHGGFTPFPIEVRDTAGRDSAEIRPAISGDGAVVYAVFNRKMKDNGSTRVGDVVVVRDDNGGNSSEPFTSLKDRYDHRAGVRVVKERTFAWDQCLGSDRLGGDLAIAVHPSNPSKVYLVWSDWVNGHTSLHLKFSTNGGQDWSKENRRNIVDAKNPGLAVNADGAVGFLYQQVVKTAEGDMWMTQFERTTDDFTSPPKPITLAKFPVSELPSCPDPKDGGNNLFLGDYLHLMSVGKNFYGIFPSCNVPDLSRFPCGVAFVRKKDFNSKKLFDQQGKNVSPSIDPFFFKVSE